MPLLGIWDARLPAQEVAQAWDRTRDLRVVGSDATTRIASADDIPSILFLMSLFDYNTPPRFQQLTFETGGKRILATFPPLGQLRLQDCASSLAAQLA